MIQASDASPNVWSVWITLITTVGPPLVAVVAMWLARKLNNIHTLVNGNLASERETTAKLKAQLRSHGIEPDV